MMGMSRLEPFSPEVSGASSGSPGSGSTTRRRPSVDLNEEPTKRLAGLVGVAINDESKEDRLESLRQRCEALRNTGRFSMNITAIKFGYNSVVSYVTFFPSAGSPWICMSSNGITSSEFLP